MTDPHHAALPNGAEASTTLPLMSRREFTRLASLVAVATACSSDSGDPVAPDGSGVTITGNVLTVPLAQNPSLNQADGMILVRAASALVIRISATEYRALSSICTHEQCTVTGFSGGVLRCPCHGSRYST
ncbi:MAG: Rieske 2Fe-2S domain-containing protein, partial [Cytophagaceae bacterium]|nr:Rieske 2Fe-2S domain-containing protein [Gemmatimonadaceae bacterium]